MTAGRFKARAHHALRRQLSRASRHCGICGRYLYHGNLSIDHVVPKSRGGVRIGNVVPAHARCNAAKADRMPTGCELVWLAAVNARLAI